jgi:hypothetical protein
MIRPMREIAENYDVDGIELNFIRDQVVFPPSKAAPKERRALGFRLAQPPATQIEF